MSKIKKIEIYRVSMPLISPFTTAYGSDDAIGSVLLRMTSEATYGWGESCPLQFPTYSPEWAPGVFLVLRDVLAPRIIGQEVSSGEQPLFHHDLIDHAKLQKQIHTPICLDESISSPDQARKAIEIDACRWINIKPGRVGGITSAKEIHDLCQDADIPCWIGGMLESAVGTSFLKALATLPNIKYPCDIFPSKRFYAEDLSEPEVYLSAPSQIDVSMAPGAGAEPNLQRLQRCTVEHAVLTA